MTIELPVLRLGLAGFSAEQHDVLSAAVRMAAPGAITWKVARLGESDAWWVNGARTAPLDDGTVRVTPGMPSERAIQLQLADITRPVAFALPIASAELVPAYTFDAASIASMRAVLGKFEAWLAPLTAQFCLASHLIEQQAALGAGVFDVLLNGRLLAVVDTRGEVGVLPSASPAGFENADWRRRPAGPIPAHLVRTTISHLMWQYCVRTERDLLPRHYRTGPLYFRRPPHLSNRLMDDSHLLLMRELACGPASFEALQQRTGLLARQLARDLASLYFVGTITANPKRATQGHRPRRGEAPESGPQSGLTSGLDSVPPDDVRARPVPSDLTAPAPMGPY